MAFLVHPVRLDKFRHFMLKIFSISWAKSTIQGVIKSPLKNGIERIGHFTQKGFGFIQKIVEKWQQLSVLQIMVSFY